MFLYLSLPSLFATFFFYCCCHPRDLHSFLHDALPISDAVPLDFDWSEAVLVIPPKKKAISIRVDEDVLDYFKHEGSGDRKSTRLNSSHLGISYAVFCLKKKKPKQQTQRSTRE